MKLHQAIDGKIKQQQALETVYSTSAFGSQFMPFMESLARHGLVPTSYKRVVNDEGHVWSDEVRRGGISITTTNHPVMEQGYAGDIIVRGPKQALELFESVISKYATYEGLDTSKLEVKIEYHDELNPAIWENSNEDYTLKSNVREALTKAAEAFVAFLKVPKVQIKDVTLTGSCANYNWTKSSDIDLHIVVDLDQAAEEYGSIVKEYFDAKKNVWNELHDIFIKTIPVEVYVQDEDEKHHSTGVYSLTDDEWVIKPEHAEPDIDDASVKLKAKEMMRMIDDALESNKASVIEKVMDKIRTMRKSGLEEAGEFSVENLAFKVLRNNGYLEKMTTIKTKTFDRELSIEEEEWSYLKDQMSKLPVRQPYIHY